MIKTSSFIILRGPCFHHKSVQFLIRTSTKQVTSSLSESLVVHHLFVKRSSGYFVFSVIMNTHPWINAQELCVILTTLLICFFTTLYILCFSFWRNRERKRRHKLKVKKLNHQLISALSVRDIKLIKTSHSIRSRCEQEG